MSSFFCSTPFTAFAPCHSSHSHTSISPAIQYGPHNPIERPKRRGSSILCCQDSETLRNYGTGSSVLKKPKENFRDNSNITTTLPKIKPCDGIGISSFLQGKNYLITGATGFVAKVIVEKLLRTVPDVGKIFVLIKAKDKEVAMERLKAEIIESELFKSIQQMHGETYKEFMMSKLIPVVGNVCESDLGMDASTANEVAKEVNVIMNAAACTTLDERYDVALNTNTKGPSHLLAFAKRCKNICLFLHISTAYVSDGEKQEIIMEKPIHLGQSKAMEKFPLGTPQSSVPMLDIDSEIKLASDWVGSTKGKDATQRMKELGLERAKVHGWPNTYSFTKAMGEMLINTLRGDIPVVIIRPAIIESSYKEPFPGWMEGNRVLDPMILNYGKGRLPGWLADPKGVVDVIPVDMVANAALAAIAKHGIAARPELPVYHIGSSVGNPVSIGVLFDYVRRHYKSFPLLDSKGNQICINEMNFFTTLGDFSSYISKEMEKQNGLLEASNLEPKLHCRLQKNSTKKAEILIQLAKIYEPYMFYKGRFDNGNTQKLYEEMSNEEMKNFGFDVKSINWEQYITCIHVPGVRKHVLKKELLPV